MQFSWIVLLLFKSLYLNWLIHSQLKSLFSAKGENKANKYIDIVQGQYVLVFFSPDLHISFIRFYQS